MGDILRAATSAGNEPCLRDGTMATSELDLKYGGERRYGVASPVLASGRITRED